MSQALETEDHLSYYKARRKGPLVSSSCAFGRIVSLLSAAPLWRWSRSQIEARHQLLDVAGTRQSIASELISQQSNAGGDNLTQRPTLHQDRRLRPEQLSRVGKATAIVHDLNNLLSIVQINLELLDRETSDETWRSLIADAYDATQLSNELIKGLFAEQAGQVTRPIPLDINEELAAIGNLIQKSLGPEIQVEQDLATDLGTVSADPALLRNACLNLVVNAGDAMASGGHLFITTSNIEVDATTASNHIDAKSGAYVMLSLRDTGSGIARETLGRIFDPYLTTKAPGQSLGLGLTLVREFCEQFDGFVRVESRVGKGTTVSIYLPRYDGRQAAHQAGEPDHDQSCY
jgi:signal transduction histidine kinase